MAQTKKTLNSELPDTMPIPAAQLAQNIVYWFAALLGLVAVGGVINGSVGGALLFGIAAICIGNLGSRIKTHRVKVQEVQGGRYI